MTPDLDQARRFLSLIAPDGDVLFQTFDDVEARKEPKLAIQTRKIERLATLNEKRGGIYVTVNRVKGDKRNASTVTDVRALFADFDGTELPTTWEIEPSLIVNTSPGKFHVYWLTDGFPREEFPDAQRAISRHFQTDGKVCDLPRVMRVPGFWHCKDEPYQIRILEGDGRRYPADELRAWIERIKPPPEIEIAQVERRTQLNGTTNVYAKVAAEKGLASLAAASKGNRNDTLNSEAFGLFGLVKGGHLPESIRDDLERVALSIGLVKSEIKATLNSAWRGAKERHPPERSFRPREIPRHDPETGEIEDDPIVPAEEEKPIQVGFGNMPFRMLGHNKGVYYYLPRGSGQVVALKTGEHQAIRLLELAPYNAWYGARGNATGAITKPQWLQFANALIQTQHQEGIFEETRIRGRGAWMDGKRVIVHTGTEATIDGTAVELNGINSRFVYEAAAPWEFGFGDAASTKEAHRLVDICEQLTWAEDMSAGLLAGWCVVAPLSGALQWRPHIWISGPSGSGKTTAQNEIVGRIVGPSAVQFEGKTTEASIRQTMGYDARPVILDEAEGEDQEAARRMQGVLDLARVSSSGGKISKGSSSHRAVVFVVRSCFCFSSIHASIKHHADESRITRLMLKKNTSERSDEDYRQLMTDIDTYFTQEYASRMFARGVKFLPVLLNNARIFTTAAAVKLKSRRAADQLGAMLAGLYLCHSEKTVDRDTAEKFIDRHEWTEHLALDSQADEFRLFAYMMSRSLRVVTNDGQRDITIGDAIEARSYARELGNIGIRLSGEEIWIANGSDRMADLLRDKPQWQADWKRSLAQLPGARKGDRAEYFAPGLVQRHLVLPRGLLGR